MGKIFISYARRDLEMVDRIVRKIEDAGVNIWIDRAAIKPGNLWRTQIVEAIDTCDAFVLILSSNSAASDNVRKEIDLAQDSGRKIFVIRLNEVKLPAQFRYQLAGLQYVDLHLLGFDEAVKELIETLKEQSELIHTPLIRQVQLVFSKADLAKFGSTKTEKILPLISALTSTSQSQLKIANNSSGTNVYVDMPASAAFKLKTRALNRDDHLNQFGIKSLRLEGDKKYVNTSLGIFTRNATMGILQLLWMSLPSLFPSILGITGGKLILFTSTIAVTTVVSIVVFDAVNAVSNSTRTPDPGSDYPITETIQVTPFSTPTQAETQGLTNTSVRAINPTSTPMPNATITPGLTRTPLPIPSRTPAPIMASNHASSHTTPPTPSPVPIPTTTSTTPPNIPTPTDTPTPTNTPIPTDTLTPAPQTPVVGQNLIHNESFEADPRTSETLWFVDQRNTDSDADWSLENARTGNYSLSLSASRSPQQGWPGWFTTNTIPIADGYIYTFSVWEFTTDGAGAWMAAYLLDANGQWLLGISTPCNPSPILDNWQLLSLSFSTQDAPGTTQVRLGLQQCLTFTEGNITSLFYDDIFFGIALP